MRAGLQRQAYAGGGRHAGVPGPHRVRRREPERDRGAGIGGEGGGGGY